jgi:squalene-hopene/tetraprenyl-beta-curcumene cyclase
VIRQLGACAGIAAIPAGFGSFARNATAAGRLMADELEPMITKGVAFLRPRQTGDGSWSPNRKEPGITGIVLSALLRSKRVGVNEPVITKGLDYLSQFLGDDGGFSKTPRGNYTTAIALLAFKEANKDGRFDPLLKNRQHFLIGKQWDESEGKDRKDPFYGGAGYGGNNSRPDLSNTAFMMEALRATGLPADDPALQKALLFVSRCQNLASEFNDQPWAKEVNDGGFIYTAAQGGTSIAGKTESGGLRSYASMTYAGLKSMIYAGLDKNDPRVKAALRFIAQNYSLEENPGLGQSGLYYYYHTFAKTMSVLDEDALVDASGVSHDWRADLVAALAKRQKPGGEWVGSSDRFMEGDPDLVTSYAILALDFARPRQEKSAGG